MNRININFLLFAFIGLVFTGCIKNDFDAPDNGGCIDEDLQINISIADLKNYFSGTAVTISEDLIIEGVVTSDDQHGNFYKSLVIQDETGGILLIIDQTNMYTSYPMGRKIYVKVKGLALDDYGGLVQLGGGINATTGDLERIPQSLVNDYIFKGPCNQAVDTLKIPVNQLNPTQHQSMLVKLQGVRMDNNDAGLPFADPNGTSAENRTVLDCNNSALIMRTSDFASFAGTATPTGTFTVTGVFSVFNSDYQLGVRTLADIDESASAGCPCVEVVGSNPGTTSYQLDKVKVVDGSSTTLIDEDFQSVGDGSVVNLSGWQNISDAGTQQWRGDSFSGETSARITAYQTGESNVINWLITPSFAVAGNGETLTFQTKDAFDDGAVLEVLISSDYDGGNSPDNFTWEKICPQISGGSSSFAPAWVPSGDVDLSGYSGNIYVAFRYKGGE